MCIAKRTMHDNTLELRKPHNGLILLDVSAFYQMVVKGFVILAAVILDRFTRAD